MRKNLLINCAFLLIAAIAFTGCKNPVEEHYIKLNTVSCLFSADAPEPMVIKVESTPAVWSVESLAAWVTVSEKTDHTFTLKATDNTLSDERQGEVVVKAGKAVITVTVVQQSLETELQSGYNTVAEYVRGAAISPNGIYVGGYYSEPDPIDNTWTKYVVITNVRTGDVYRLDPFPSNLYSIYNPEAITDSGDLIFHCEDNRAIMFSIDGTIQIIPDVDGKHKPWFSQVGSDESKVWVGFCLNAGGTLYSPVKWTDGIAEILPKPAETYRGNRPWVQGCMARGCSLDGKKVYGTAWEGHDTGLIWWDENNEPRWVSREVREVDMFDTSTGTWGKYNLVNGVTGTSQPYSMSPSGKWLTGTYYEEDLNEAKTEIVLTSYPAFYDTENDQLYTFPEYKDAAGITVTDDGIGVIGLGASSGMTNSTEMINIATGVRISTSTEWVRQTMGIIIPDDSILEFISPDQKAALGYDLHGVGGELMRKWYVYPKPGK